MNTYKYIGTHADYTMHGQPVAPGDSVQLDDEDPLVTSRRAVRVLSKSIESASRRIRNNQRKDGR